MQMKLVLQQIGNGQLYGTGFDANGIVIGNSDGYTGTKSAVTNASNTSACLDTDSDGIYDTIDIDDDNDGILDTEEYGADIPELLGPFFGRNRWQTIILETSVIE